MHPRLLIPFAFAAAALAQDAEPKPTTEQLNFFEKKIRPVLAEHCYKCHSERSEKIRGGLVLDTRDGIRRGGDNGPAVVPGKLDESLLIEAVRYANKDFAMPPEKSGGKLSDAVIADFEAWVKMGAPDPRHGEAKVVKKYDAEEAKKWWAFQAPARSAPPEVKDGTWPRGDLDRFLLAGLEAKGLKPVSDADAATLIRRVYFDLTGLPPTLKETDDFMKDTSPEALAKVVDRLLASPRFGERWGRHWLDVARFAESSGKDVNLAYPHAWRYRDYVIAAFNAGKPYDEFIREQIAGDLLPAKDENDRAENLVATGFLAIGAKSHNEMNPRQYFLDLADEQIDATSQAVLGLTVACARCHDHKFDPIPQRDYYAMAGIFLSTDTRYGTVQGVQNRHPSELVELPKGASVAKIDRKMSPEDLTRAKARLEALQKEQQEIFGDRMNSRAGPEARPQVNAQDQQRILRIVTQIGQVEGQLKSFDENGYPKALAMGVQELPSSRASTFGANAPRPGRGRFRGARPPDLAIIADSALYARGETDRPGERVPRGFPALLTKDPVPEIPAGASGRRELAEWLTTKSNPLTARVFVNRAWHWLFGRGLVESCDNFGTTGSKPANQALLDTLAVKFMEGGWNVKALVRELVLSHAYALGSAYDDKAFHADPENMLVWRASKRRLDAECVRDAILAASGQLEGTAPAGNALANNGEGPIIQRRGLAGGGRGFGTDEDTLVNSGGATFVRSVYLPIARDVTPDALAVFDFVDSTLVTGTRETTNVPAQALFLLNSSFVAQQSGKFAERVMAAYPGGPNAAAAARLDERLRYAYWLVFNRAPDATERQAAASFFAKFPSNWAKGDSSSSGLKDAEDVKAAWTSFCRALFASAEFRYLN
jgi:hypothetical protein